MYRNNSDATPQSHCSTQTTGAVVQLECDRHMRVTPMTQQRQQLHWDQIIKQPAILHKLQSYKWTDGLPLEHQRADHADLYQILFMSTTVTRWKMNRPSPRKGLWMGPFGCSICPLLHYTGYPKWAFAFPVDHSGFMLICQKDLSTFHAASQLHVDLICLVSGPTGSLPWWALITEKRNRSWSNHLSSAGSARCYDRYFMNNEALFFWHHNTDWIKTDLSHHAEVFIL